MLGNVQAMTLIGWRLCKLYENGKMTPGHASLGKVSLNLEGTLSDIGAATALCIHDKCFFFWCL